MKIGFVGAGSMAAAMARGWAGAEGVEIEPIFTDGGSGRAEELADALGGEEAEDNEALADHAELLVLAMKPAQLADVAEELAGSDVPVLSLLGATSLEALSAALPAVPIARVMPNVGVEIRQGVLCYAFSDRTDDAFRKQITGLLETLGTAIEIDDALIDVATAVMGCSPAYMALLCEALLAAATENGLTEPEARRMVVETMAGTAALMRDRDPAGVRAAVTSPGGSTEAGLAALEQGEFSQDLADAVKASLEKMRR